MSPQLRVVNYARIKVWDEKAHDIIVNYLNKKGYFSIVFVSKKQMLATLELRMFLY